MLRRYLLFISLLVLFPLGYRLLVGAETGGAGIKAMLVPVARLYLDVFNSPMTAVLLCLGMIVLGAGLFLFYWLGKIAPALRDLKSLNALLHQNPVVPGSPEALASVDAAVSTFTLLTRPWSLYRSTLIENSDGRITSQFQPSQYFSLRRLEQSGVRLRLFLGLPNDFVGIGLVFTFLGLVAGLYFASKSMMTGDLAEARGALVQLLHAATFKFLTSITGISISLVLSAAQRMLLDRLQAGLDELQSLLEESFPLARGNAIPVLGRPIVAARPRQAAAASPRHLA